MRTFLRLFILFIFWVLPMILMGQGKQSDSLLAETYVFGGSVNHYPYELIDEKGKMSGFHIELIQEIAKVAGFRVEFKFQPWYKNRKALEEGKGVDITDMFFSEARDQKVDFSQTLEVVNYRIFVRPEDQGINSLEELKGKKIIVEQGSAVQEDLVKMGYKDELVLAETESDALLLLASGENDFAIVTEDHGYWFVRNHDIKLYSVGPPVFPQKLCFAVKQGRTDLVMRLNIGLYEVRRSGRYRELYYKWFGAPQPKSKLLFYLEEYGWWILTALLIAIGLVVVWSALLKIKVNHRTMELREVLEMYRRTEAQLRRSEARLESTQAFSLVMMSYLDIHGRFRKVPPTLCSFLKYDPKDLLNKRIQDVLGKKGQSIFDKLIELIQHERLQTYNLETKLKRKDGSKVWAFINFSVMLDDNGRPAELLLFIRDINSEKVAEEKLMHKTQDLNKLIYKLSHDLRGPLTTIMGLVNLAKFDIKDTYANKFFHLIEHQVDFLDKILKDLSALQSVEEVGLAEDLLNLDELLSQVKKSLESNPGFDEVDIDWSIDYSETFYGDRKLLELIFYHLLDNSLAFYDENKERRYTKVSIFKEGNQMQIEVEDNGVGIEKEIQPHVFKMFYRGHEQSKGSGLGLFIVKSAVEKLQGNIRFTSEEGKGTMFIVSLPVLHLISR